MNKLECLNLSLCFIEFSMMYIFFEKLFKKRLHNKILPVAIPIINALIVYFIPDFSVTKSILCVLSVFSGCSILFKEKIYIRSVFSITMIYILYIIDIVIGNILSLILDQQVLEVFYGNFSCRLVSCLIIKLIDILAVIMLYRAFKKSSLNLSKRVWILFNIVMIVFLSVTVAYMNIYPEYNENQSLKLMFTAISISFLVMSIIVIYFFTYICASFQQSKNLYLLQTSYAAINEKLSVQLENNQKLHKIRHDIKNHLLNIRSLIDRNQVNDAVQLLNQVIGQTENISVGITQTTGNSIIDAVISYKATVCFNKDITFRYTLEKLPELSIDLIDISSVVSNLIDNAIEATEKTNDPCVQVSISNYNNYLVVFVKNSCNNTFTSDKDEKKLLSTKSDKSLHGYGMQIVNDIAVKYDGDCKWEISDGFFAVNVLLKCF